MSKYATNPNENEVLPNLLGITDVKEIAISEYEGFLYAEIILSNELKEGTIFNADYILNIHKLALQHLYSFAGNYRQVNIAKGGFQFPAAMFLAQSMDEFNKEVLLKLPKKYKDESALIKKVAEVHAELLFIHPFREGNGRTCRILANLMVRQQGYDGLKFEMLDDEMFPKYVKAVQLASKKDYSLMEEIISALF